MFNGIFNGDGCNAECAFDGCANECVRDIQQAPFLFSIHVDPHHKPGVTFAQVQGVIF